jgi:hypothetical protein
MSSSGHEFHAAAVAAAKSDLEELQGRVAHSAEQCGQLIGSILAAVGDPPATDAGQGALGLTAALQERLNEAAGMCTSIEMELDRYRQGF